MQKLKLTQEALKRAVDNYQRWYQGETLRGPNGFFSWLRHGTTGQNRAKELNAAIHNDTSFTDAANRINDFLTTPSTRYHRHSLASFLLDELVQNDKLGWKSIVPNTSNIYDANEVKGCAKFFDLINPCL
ncbi:MAG: hypothetical protein LEGION0403_FIIPPAGN_01215 [Legionella sp.]|uniref:hypothetical protein n=1 Tax=Legionella sp. TaxID=459 RepID=UPI003D13ED84